MKANKTHIQHGKGENPVQYLQHQIKVRENGPSDQTIVPPITSEVISDTVVKSETEEKKPKLEIPDLVVKDENRDWWFLE